MGDDPPFLSVGTEVSAKYKGAFCEAKIRKVSKCVKCKVIFKNNLGSYMLLDEHIKGDLKVGSVVEAKHPEKGQCFECSISKIQDCSQYTVVFDDGDITTLRRTALCLKSGRHYAESESLDQLPLTHPEHFSNPVVGGRKGKKSKTQLGESSEDEEQDPDSENFEKVDTKKFFLREESLGKVVCVEVGDKKKQSDNWFPGLVVHPSSQESLPINVIDEYLIKSFSDGRYYAVAKNEATEFTKDVGAKVENTILKAAVDKVLLYLNKDELPPHWDREVLFGSAQQNTNSDSDSSTDEIPEEKDHFVAQLYKYMDDRSTPINRAPTIYNQDLDLYRLFMLVQKFGGSNKVTEHNLWRKISLKMGFSLAASAKVIKQAYKRYLQSFEEFYRKLGCSGYYHIRSNHNRKESERSLVKDKDHCIGKQLLKFSTDKEEIISNICTEDPMVKQDIECSSFDTHRDLLELPPDAKEHLLKSYGEKKDAKRLKEIDKKSEKVNKKERKDDSLSKRNLTEEDHKCFAKKKIEDDELTSIIDQELVNQQNPLLSTDVPINVGDRLKVLYGPTKEIKYTTYEAKVLEVEGEDDKLYYVHYFGWNNRYDEWIRRNRISENLSWSASTGRKTRNASSLISKNGQTFLRSSRLRRISSNYSKKGEDVNLSQNISGSAADRKRFCKATVNKNAFLAKESREEIFKDDEKHNENMFNSQNLNLENSPLFNERIFNNKEQIEPDFMSNPNISFSRVQRCAKRGLNSDKVINDFNKDAIDVTDSFPDAKGRDIDLIQIRSEMKGLDKAKNQLRSLAQLQEFRAGMDVYEFQEEIFENHNEKAALLDVNNPFEETDIEIQNSNFSLEDNNTDMSVADTSNVNDSLHSKNWNTVKNETELCPVHANITFDKNENAQYSSNLSDEIQLVLAQTCEELQKMSSESLPSAPLSDSSDSLGMTDLKPYRREKRKPRRIKTKSKEFVQTDEDSDLDSQHRSQPSITKQSIDCSATNINISNYKMQAKNMKLRQNSPCSKSFNCWEVLDVPKNNYATSKDTVIKSEPDSVKSLLCEEIIPHSPDYFPEMSLRTLSEVTSLRMDATFPSLTGFNAELSKCKTEQIPEVKTELIYEGSPISTPCSVYSTLESPLRETELKLFNLDEDNGSSKSPQYSSEADLDPLDEVRQYDDEDKLRKSLYKTCQKKFKLEEEILRPVKRKRRKTWRNSRSFDDDDTDKLNNGKSEGINSVYNNGVRSRFNFAADLEDGMNSSERIAIIQQKLVELRHAYLEIKAEVASIDKRRKKLRKKKEVDDELPVPLEVPS